MAKIHTLANGATVLSISLHPFKFSDGTVSEPQDADVVNSLTLARETREVGSIKGMGVVELRMVLLPHQQEILADLCKKADIVILPFPVLASLREQGIRDRFPNALAFTATKETQRAAPDGKIVDVDAWSY